MIGCEQRDQDLLLLVHGGLSPFKAAATRLHLRKCANCQARAQEMGLVSQALARSVSAGSSHWAPALGVGLLTFGALKAALALVAALVASYVLFTELRATYGPPAPAYKIAPGEGNSCEVPKGPIGSKTNFKADSGNLIH